MDLECIKQAISCNDVQFIYELINDEVVLQRLINVDRWLFCQVLSTAINIDRGKIALNNVNGIYDDITLQHIKAAKEMEYVMFQNRGKMLLTLALENCKRCKLTEELLRAASYIGDEFEINTPLLCEVLEENFKDLITEFINQGANVNCRDENGRTLLFYGMQKYYDCPDFIKMLLDAGSNLCDLDNKGRNALMVLDCKCFDGRDFDSSFNYDCTVKESIDILLQYGIGDIDIKHTDNEGNTILHLTNCEYLFHLAIRYGVSVNAINYEGQTPLLREVKLCPRRDEKIVYLIKSGADVNVTNERLQTALHLWKWNVVEEVLPSAIHFLLFYGGNMFARDSNNQTPLDILIENYSWDKVTAYIIPQHIILFDDNEFDFDKKALEKIDNSEYVSSFIVECKKEVKLMRKTFIANGLTFYEFCLLRQYYNNKCINISRDEYKFTDCEICRMFPIYYDLILIRIKDNHLKKCKLDLRKRFEKVTLSPVQSVEINFNDVLNYDCLYHLSKYLQYKEMFNIFCAAIES